MNPVKLYFVDEKDEARWANTHALKCLLDTTNIEVIGLAPFQEFAQYDSLLADPLVRGFFIDQRMRGGGVNYNGIELAEYLRGHHPKLPVYILTGHPTDDFTSTAYRVEDIVDKEDIEDRESEKAQMLRARILRRLAIFEDVLNEREKRFHDLLVKSLREALTPDEEKELGLLEDERVLQVHAQELSDSKSLIRTIEELKAKLAPEKLKF
jgi:DNA-binding LytR/AlgR family response regulator